MFSPRHCSNAKIKFPLLILALALLVAGFTVGPASADTYTAENPYEIGTPAQLQAFKTYIENTAGADESVYAKLTDDIELVDWSGTIGYTNAKPYKGVFDGGGYKISLINEKVDVNLTNTLWGLFWKISAEGTVTNLDLEVRIWPYLNEESTAATGRVNPVAWRNEGTIEDVTVYC